MHADVSYDGSILEYRIAEGAPKENITVRTSYNLSGMSFSPKEIRQSLLAFFPNFEIEYQSDFRQQIADSWPNSIDDSYAQKDWGWKAQFDTEAMVEVMLKNVKA